MKSIYNKLLVLFVLVALSGCTLDKIENPNAPTVSSFEEGATQQDLRLLTTGLEAVIRNDMGFHYQTVSILGREYNDLTQVDPRYTGEILIGPLDNNGFLTTRAYAAWYKVVQTANLLLTAVDNSATSLSTPALDGYRGYARTFKAYALMMVANRQYSNGIRIDVDDPDNLGAFVSYDNALTAIETMLNTANTELLNAASEFAAGEDQFDFALSSGFAGFDSPATFAEFNRALAARVAIYQGDKAAALSYLADSFMDEAGSLDAGPAHVFGLTGNDISNPLFYVPNQQRYMAHPSFEADAEAGDTRVAEKTSLFDPEDDPDQGPITVTFDGLSGDRQVTLYSSNVDPVSIIRNEELLLIYAEANIGTNNVEALRVLDIIRASASLGGSTANPLIDSEVEDEMLTQRRYSLFGEGHRWVDLRRYDRLGDLPLDRAGDSRISEFPTPFAENQ
ncbi:RagB/SusD domain-containing protein [Ekhidna lutea]|uniref:RagB/SusD domain-containing protein n=1 Tax=Ekhidna lutea TaxID=447679 RepID=A0A239JWX4_EKHLU|nr:RagB/SusD family nutrient uptake outer membrane protein [Ekhidna lutea]SNT10466.1 RagB/SusD domain-containing protein [Ekhidna lutea]